jgi:hypothetical protein
MPSYVAATAVGGRATSVVADATNEADIVALFDKAGADDLRSITPATTPRAR